MSVAFQELDMTCSRIGGVLVLAACALLVITAILAIAGSAVSVLGPGPGGAAITASFVLLAAGAAGLGLAGVPPLDGRLLRFGLGVLAVGLLVATASATAPMDSSLIFVFLAGLAVTWIGFLVTIAGLLGTAGRPRRSGGVFLGGLVITMVAAWLSNTVGPIVAAPAALAGATSVLASMASIGLMGIRAVRPANPVAGTPTERGRQAAAPARHQEDPVTSGE